MADFGGGEGGFSPLQTVDKKLFSPEGGRIALSANERIAEFLNFAIQAKFAYVNKLRWAQPAFLFSFDLENRPETAHSRKRRNGGGFRQIERRKRRADPFLRLIRMCAIMLYNIKAMKEGLSHANPLYSR